MVIIGTRRKVFALSTLALGIAIKATTNPAELTETLKGLGPRGTCSGEIRSYHFAVRPRDSEDYLGGFEVTSVSPNRFRFLRDSQIKSADETQRGSPRSLFSNICFLSEETQTHTHIFICEIKHQTQVISPTLPSKGRYFLVAPP